MKISTRTIRQALLALCCLAPASPGRAQDNQQPAPGPAPAGPRMVMRRAMRPGRNQGQGERLLGALNRPEVQKALGLTEEQRKKIEDIAFNAEKSAIPQRAALQVQRLELRRLMRADNPDRPAIEKKIQEIAQAQTALSRTRINTMLDVRGVLTKEQRDKIRDRLSMQPGPQRNAQDMRPMMRQRMQGMHQGPPAAPSPQPQQPPRPPGQ
jgi:Spy/CpxP family protein refolding chaperone